VSGVDSLLRLMIRSNGADFERIVLPSPENADGIHHRVELDSAALRAEQMIQQLAAEFHAHIPHGDLSQYRDRAHPTGRQ